MLRDVLNKALDSVQNPTEWTRSVTHMDDGSLAIRLYRESTGEIWWELIPPAVAAEELTTILEAAIIGLKAPAEEADKSDRVLDS